MMLVTLLIAGCGGHAAAPVTDRSPDSENQAFYSVLSGDTLFAIAFRSGVDVQDLARWNNIKAPYTIYVGSNLRLRPKSTSLTTSQDSSADNETPKPAQAITKKAASKPLPKVALPPKVGQWVWPAKGKLVQSFSINKGNNGIQIAASESAPVSASAAGQVVYAGNGIRGYGQLIIIQHSDAFLSAYAHNKTMLVQEGQSIKQGQKIAEVGSTGTNEIKLHFEIRKDGRPVNPLKYLPLKSA
ncbi:MAG: lipoprotein NlpD [Saprospiraceae bacterium]|jgi:lipoprotein NlpD